MATPSAARLVGQYERGVITRMELILRLILLAAEAPTQAIARDLPADCLDELRASADRPPSSVEGCPRIAGIDSPFGEADRPTWFVGIWRWHDHFAGTS